MMALPHLQAQHSDRQLHRAGPPMDRDTGTRQSGEVVIDRAGTDGAVHMAAHHGFFLFGAISLKVGPTSIEAIPVHLRATALPTVIAVGEMFGGGDAPISAGHTGHRRSMIGTAD